MQTLFLILSFALNMFSVYLGFMALYTFKRRKPYPAAAPKTRFAVIIPARNEEKVIGNLIRALREQRYPQDQIDIYVAANHCTDATEDIARSMGARILPCRGTSCKGDVLHQVIEALLPLDYDAFAFFDADNLPVPDFMQRMNDALAAGERVCKGRLKAGNALESWVAGGYGLYHAAMEWTYSRPHSAAGCSSNLVGTAFVAHREVFEALGGWNTESLCEDTEFAAQCTRIGRRVAWVPEAMSYDEQVTRFGVSLGQRLRWCSGMIHTARHETRRLLSRRCPKRRMAIDLAMLFIISHTQPIAVLVMLASLPFLSPLLLAATGAGLALSYAGLALLAVLLCLLGGYPLGKMSGAIALFPLFMASWIPIQIVALFEPVRRWNAIEHTGQPVEEVEGAPVDG